MSEATDKGVHFSPQDLVDIELTNARWESVTEHHNSPTWISPLDGKIYPTALALQLCRSGERGDDPFIVEAQQAAREAAKASSPKKVK